MKQFFKMMFASMLGFIMALLIISIISFFLLLGVISVTKNETVAVPEKTILHLTLDQTIMDRSSDDPMSYISRFDIGKTLGLNEILSNLKKAASDPKICGIFLDLSDIPASSATIEEIRNALLEFKSSGKFIVSYAEVYSQKSYYLASVSDKMYLNPAGSMEFKGLAGRVMFFKGLMDKLDIEAQVIRHGKFKSAVEPFLLDKMSPASREQTLSYVSAIWQHMIDGISKARNISGDSLKIIADNHLLQVPTDAVNLHFVDKLTYRDEILEELRIRAKVTSIKNLSLIKLPRYTKSSAGVELPDAKERIAIIYAQGDIVSGDGDNQTIGSDRLSKAIRKARLDPNIKAVVLRVNSPGGSALASDVIWREVKLTKEAKPVVVSMGDVAASGGYYISCAGTKIFASPNTITGSIGVFGIVPNTQKFFNNKLGITFDEVKTNPYSDYIPVTRPMSENEKQFLQRDIEKIYSDFISHVAQGRKMRVSEVDSIGQGRVWSGTDAKRLGLVDEFGGMRDAVKEAAKLAKLSKYKIIALPEQENVFTQILSQLSGENIRSKFIKDNLHSVYPYLNYLERIKRMTGVQAMMPVEIEIN